MNIAVGKLSTVVNDLISEYELDRSFITLVGGGGSGAVAVPALAEKMGFRWKIARNAPYISAIGVALAMVREQLERTVVDPTEEDIRKIRADVLERIVKSGANESTVDIAIEIDARKNILRAIATGATELRQKDPSVRDLPREQLADISADALGISRKDVEFVCNVSRWTLFEGKKQKKILFGLLNKKSRGMAVVDREGVVRLRKENADYICFAKGQRALKFDAFLDQHTTYSDANASIPKVFAFYGEKMLDLTGMQTKTQLLSILEVETEALQPDEKILAVAYR